MELEINSVPPGSICEGCLSVDRKLTAEFSEESRKYFNEILDPLDHVHQPLWLCWECLAHVSRALRFRKQVRQAHDCLVRYMLHQLSHPTSLSNLTTTKPRNYGSSHFETPKDETSSTNQLKNTSKGCDFKVQNEAGPPLFIKMEDDDVDFEDLGEFYADENGVEDLKAVLVSDGIQYEIPVEENKSKSKKTRRKTEIEFDDSDDEPLKLKKEKEESDFKPRGRKKKTENVEFDDSDDEPLKLKKEKEESDFKPRGRKKKTENVGPKIDRRKHPAPKREKPAGVVNNPRVKRKLQELNVSSDQLEMVVLSWDEVEAERQKALHSAVFTRHDYRCYDCVLGFNHKFKLENHMKKHDATAGELLCSVCRIRCRDAHALCAHRRRHRVRWRCCSCGETASRAAVAADHFARAHGAGAPPPTHVCSTCGHREPTLGKLRNHLKNHAERQKCELCGKTFRDRTSLRTHLFIHKGVKEYSCPRCGKQFLFKKAMEVHLVTHDAPAQLYCYDCDMNFKNRMSYYQHMKYNLKHIDPAKLKYACPLCDKKFVKAARLEEHNAAVHLKVTPIQCTVPDCNFACSSRPVLRTHVRMVHRNQRVVRNHVCDTCGKAYTTKKTLEGHMRSHTGERPFQCQQCPSTFGYEAALYNHNKLVHLKAKIGRGRAPASGPAGLPPGAVAGWQLNLNTLAQGHANTEIS